MNISKYERLNITNEEFSLPDVEPKEKKLIEYI